MKLTRRKTSDIAKNASTELNLMDTFLALPKNHSKGKSWWARKFFRLSEKFGNIASNIEPHEIHANERLIEIPFIFQNLPEQGKILDVGCSSSPIALQLAALNYSVTGIDVRDYHFHHPNIKFHKEDIAKSTIAKDSHDCAIILSTIEHVGLGHYGDKKGLSDADFLNISASYVKPGGIVLLTVPFGKFFEGSWYRVYDSQHLNQLIDGFKVVKKQFHKRLDLLSWETCQEEELAQIDSSHHPMNGVALIKLEK